MAFSSYYSAVIVAVLLVVGTAEAQSDCVSKLLPCADYLNSTTPSAECCNSMKEVVETQLDCLCGLLKNQASFGINMTQALQLPKYCQISSDTSACNALAPNPSNIPPPAVPGGNSGNGAGHVSSWMGMPAILLASALAFFY